MTIPVFRKHLGILVTAAVISVLLGYGIVREYKAENTRQAAIPAEMPPGTKNIDNYIRSQMAGCFIKGMNNACYETAVNEWYGRFALAQILAALERTEQEREVFVRCHQTTHYLGRNNFTTAQTIADAYGRCTPVCHGSCYHGVIEGYFQENNLYSLAPEDDILPQIIPTICGRAEDYASSRLFRECHHGIGHGLMFLTNMNLPVSLKLCDLLPHRQDQEACYGGVFMENSSSSTNTDHFSQYIDTDDPLYPCNTLEERYLSVCYAYQSSFFSILTDQDWEKVIDLCFQVPQDYQKGCFEILGSNQVGYSQDDTMMKRACSLVPDATMRNFCIGGVINGLGGRYVAQPSSMSDFCSIVDTENKKICYSRMGEALASSGHDGKKIRKICENIADKEYVTVCRNQ